MALEALLAALEQEAGAKATSMLDAARADADRILAQAEADMARRRKDALQLAGSGARAAEQARLAELRRTVRAAVMRTRAAMLDRVFERARALFGAASCDPAFRAALPRHLEEALAYAGAADAVTLRCRPELAAALGALVADRPGVTVVEDDAVGWGIRLRDDASGLEVDNTLDARLDRARGALAIELLRAVEARGDASLG
jgi:vacuolar-type H+-ATPase subunit E/Vma4